MPVAVADRSEVFVPRRYVRRKHLEELKGLVVRHRADWPAVFSVTPGRDVFLFTTYGYTKEQNRIYIRRQDIRLYYPLLDEIVHNYLRRRSEGGRFFVNDEGAYYRDDNDPEKPILKPIFLFYHSTTGRHPDRYPRRKPGVSSCAQSIRSWFDRLTMSGQSNA